MNGTFAVTLRSDSNLGVYPGNTPSDFTSNMASPIQLSGDWKVALTEMSVQITWPKMESIIKVYLISSMFAFQGDKSLLSDIIIAKRLPPLLDESVPFSFADPLPYLERFRWTYEVATMPNARKIFKYHTIKIPSGNYKTSMQLGSALARAMNTALTRAYNLSNTKVVQYQYNYGTNEGRLRTLHDKLSVFLLFEQHEIPSALGLVYKHILPPVVWKPSDGLYDFEEPEFRPVYFALSDTGTSFLQRPINLSNFNLSAIYVYSDIVENQLVGNDVAPLLGIVPLQRTQDVRQAYKFVSPAYLPVSSRNFSSIRIILRAANGDPIPFPNNSPNVVCTLHFKQYNRGI